MSIVAGQLWTKPSCPVPTIVEVREYDAELELVTFLYKRRKHALPQAKFISQFSEQVK